MVYNETPLLAASSVYNTETLTTINYKKLFPKVVRPLSFVSFQPFTQTIDENDIQNMVSCDRATIAPGNKLPNNASQRHAVDNDPPISLD